MCRNDVPRLLRERQALQRCGLLSSQRRRYGFTAMFALVIFVVLLVFSLVYIRVSGGLKSAYE